MPVIEFPIRHAAQRSVGPQDGTCAEIIDFPPPPAGLTRRDIGVLFLRLHALGDDWLVQTERDGNGALWAIIAPSDPSEHDYRAFLVCRQGRRLILIDARLTARWQALGVFLHAEALADALTGIIGSKHGRRPRASI